MFFSRFPELDVLPSWSSFGGTYKDRWCKHPLPCGLATNIENDADDAGKKKKKKKKNARSTLSTGGGQRGKGGKRAWFYLSSLPEREKLCGQKGRSLWKYL